MQCKSSSLLTVKWVTGRSSAKTHMINWLSLIIASKFVKLMCNSSLLQLCRAELCNDVPIPLAVACWILNESDAIFLAHFLPSFSYFDATDAMVSREDIRPLVGLFKTLFLYYMELSALFVYVWTEKLYRLFVPRPLKSIANEIILITGTGNGIGKQIALQLADTDPTATIVCWDVETAANEGTVAELRAKNVKAHGYTVDVSDREAISNTAERMRSEVGDVSILVNNAGIAPAGTYLYQKPETIERIMKINAMASFWTIREFMPAMIRKNHGHVVTIASLSSFMPCRELSVYSSSKCALNGFIEALKAEIRFLPSKPYNIHFTTVYPIIVTTRLFDQVELRTRWDGMIPVISPEYVAQKTIEGFRQNYEHIFLPPAVQFLAICRTIFPAEIIRKFEEDILQCEITYMQGHGTVDKNANDAKVKPLPLIMDGGA